MYDAITIPCNDQCDSQCELENTFYLDVVGLTQDQFELIESTEGCTTLYLSHEQMKLNHISANDPLYCPIEKGARIDISLNTVCLFCAQ